MRRRHVPLLVTRRFKLRIITITHCKAQNGGFIFQGAAARGGGGWAFGTGRWEFGVKTPISHPKPLSRITKMKVHPAIFMKTKDNDNLSGMKVSAFGQTNGEGPNCQLLSP